MRLTDLNWMRLESYLDKDDRAVLPKGTTAQHAYLGLCVDNILAERVAVEADHPWSPPTYQEMLFIRQARRALAAA